MRLELRRRWVLPLIAVGVALLAVWLEDRLFPPKPGAPRPAPASSPAPDPSGFDMEMRSSKPPATGPRAGTPSKPPAPTSPPSPSAPR